MLAYHSHLDLCQTKIYHLPSHIVVNFNSATKFDLQTFS